MKNPSFLLVEENSVALRELAESLEYLGYKDIQQVRSASEAWTILKIREFDCVICAWEMAEMSGLALLKIVRTDERYLELPFFLTDPAFTQAKVVDAGRAGVTGLIVKPFKVETLKSKIESMGRLADAGVSPEIRRSFNEGMKLLEGGQYQEALAVFEKLVEHEENPEVYYNIGYIKTVKEEYAEAIEAFRKATSLDRYFAKAFEAMGRAYRAMGAPEEAEKCLKKAAEIYLSNEKEEKAEGILNEILQENPDTINVYNTLGVLYRKRGQYQEALRQYEKALKIHPDQPYVYYNMGRLYVDLEDLIRAKANFEKALALAPDFKDAREALDAILLGQV